MSVGTAVVVIVSEFVMEMSEVVIHRLECIHHSFDNMTVVYWKEKKIKIRNLVRG